MPLRSRVTIDTINTLVRKAEYAVRGPIVSKSVELSERLREAATGKSDKKLPFDELIACNIGNPQALKQKPVSFTRDVLSLVMNPSLQERTSFPADVLSRANKYINSIPNIGAYSESQGIPVVREEVAEFLHRRDGYLADIANIFLTNGASEGVRLCMTTIMRNPAHGYNDGILVPIPQYPLYSALTTLVEGQLVPYYLDESKNWGCGVNMLSESLQKAHWEGIAPRGIVIINPGNPTSQILSEKNMREIAEWCAKEEICLLADEVYQENVWKSGANFISFRKVAYDMGLLQDDKGLQLISFHSTSKGFVGECGLRGGYFEMLGFPTNVRNEIVKLCSLSLCSNTIGQIATGLMVNPPRPEEPSYPLYEQEKDGILQSLSRRAHLLSEALNELEGVECSHLDGALYAFPSIVIPKKAIQAAIEKEIEADLFYAIELLEETGIVVVPGSGFGQVEGTYHFRMTILPPEDKMNDVTQKMREFHTKFLKKYS